MQDLLHPHLKNTPKTHLKKSTKKVFHIEKLWILWKTTL